MAALSANTQRDLRSSRTASFQIKNTSQLYVGSLVAIDSVGYAIPYTGAAGERLMGRALPTPRADDLGKQLLGDTAAVPIPEVTVAVSGEIWEQATVTGVASIADIGKVVYASNDNDLTLTRPARGEAVGIVTRWHTSTTCDVLVFGASERLAQQGAGLTELICLGLVDAANSGAAGDDFTGIKMPFRGKILSTYAMMVVAAVGVGGTQDYNLEIDAVNVTGGVITVDTATSAKGSREDGTAITGANVFSEGALLDVEHTTGTDLTAGQFNLFIVVERLAGV